MFSFGEHLYRQIVIKIYVKQKGFLKILFLSYPEFLTKRLENSDNKNKIRKNRNL